MSNLLRRNTVCYYILYVYRRAQQENWQTTVFHLEQRPTANHQKCRHPIHQRAAMLKTQMKTTQMKVERFSSPLKLSAFFSL